MEKNKKKKSVVDHSKEHFNNGRSIDSQDPTGSYTGQPDPDLSDTPIQDADDL